MIIVFMIVTIITIIIFIIVIIIIVALDKFKYIPCHTVFQVWSLFSNELNSHLYEHFYDC